MNKVKLLLLFISIVVALLVSGCVAVDRRPSRIIHNWEWSTFGWTGHTDTVASMDYRWYEYERGWNLVTGSKAPWYYGGFIDVIFSPQYWFWYGPYETGNIAIYHRHFKPGCAECEDRKQRLQHYYEQELEKRKDDPEAYARYQAYIKEQYGTTNLLVEPTD